MNLEEIKEEVAHVRKDYYVGAPILSLKQIDWLIKQAEKTATLEKVYKVTNEDWKKLHSILSQIENAFNNTSMLDEEFIEFVGEFFDDRTRD